MLSTTGSGTPANRRFGLPEERETGIIVPSVQDPKTHTRVEPRMRVARGGKRPFEVSLFGEMLGVREIRLGHREVIIGGSREERAPRGGGPHALERLPRELEILRVQRPIGHGG